MEQGVAIGEIEEHDQGSSILLSAIPMAIPGPCKKCRRELRSFETAFKVREVNKERTLLSRKVSERKTKSMVHPTGYATCTTSRHRHLRVCKLIELVEF
jgi:hypothetical protein